MPPRNGIGVTGFVLGLVGLVFSPIPFIGVIAWPLVILGLILSIIGLARVKSGKASNKGLSITGIALSALGLIVCIVWIFVFNAAVDQVNEEINRTAKVSYEITGDAKNVEVIYGEVLNPVTETVPTLPWNKDAAVEQGSREQGRLQGRHAHRDHGRDRWLDHLQDHRRRQGRLDQDRLRGIRHGRLHRHLMPTALKP